MMKIFFALLLISVFGFSSLIAQNGFEVNRHRDRDGLLGAVKKTETYLIDFSLQNNVVVEQKRPWVTNTYDVRGNFSENVVYLHDGNLHTDIYLYDADSRNVECRTYSNESDKAADKYQKYIHKFDANGNLTERIVTEFDGSPTARFVFKYDARGNEIEYRNYFHTGALGGKTVYAYSDDGKIISRISYNADNVLAGKSLFVYDKKQKTEQTTIYWGEILKYKILFSMDDKGRIVQKETQEFNAVPNLLTSHAPKPGKIIYIHDDKNKTVIELNLDINGVLKTVSTMIFDREIAAKDAEKNNVVENVQYEAGGSLDEIMRTKNKTLANLRKFWGTFKSRSIERYEYDTQGNWTKKTHLYQTRENEQPRLGNGQYRIISYY